MRCHEDSEEESGVRERPGRDDVLAGDVDGREPGRGQQADEEEVDELAVPECQCLSWRSGPAIGARKARRARTQGGRVSVIRGRPRTKTDAALQPPEAMAWIAR
jgi:hypothetical protein